MIEFTQEALVSLLTLTVLEVVLGIDNIIFISILADKLPTAKEQKKTRQLGLLIGMVVRVLLLLCIGWIISQDKNVLFNMFGHPITLKNLVLILGGLFLLFQSTREIHFKMKGIKEESNERTKAKGYSGILLQMIFLNIVFSLDSVITAIGMADHLWVMISAVVISMFVMMLASSPISKFVNRNPSIKVLALSFLVLIGVSLMGEGFEQHINKGYIYFAMAFSFIVEIVNLRIDKHSAKRPL
jgi:predicted tellurium resistance membrane protein TerC